MVESYSYSKYEYGDTKSWNWKKTKHTKVTKQTGAYQRVWPIMAFI